MGQVTRSIFATRCFSTVSFNCGKNGLSGSKAMKIGWFSASSSGVPESTVASWFHWVT
ncbi:hypothetical protein D3C81_1616760 [compost metagenome]